MNMRWNYFFILCLGLLHINLRAQNFAAESVLKQGNWIKIAVAQDGIYDLSINALTQAGLNITNRNHIAVFAGHPTMLPMPNRLPFTDDLVQIPIQVLTNNQSEIQTIRFFGKGPNQWYVQPDSFYYQKNIYADSNYYFVTELPVPSLKISGSASILTENNLTNTYDAFWAVDHDKKSVSRSGQQWYDDELDGSRTREYATDFNHLVTGAPIDLILNVGARSYSVNTWVTIKEQNGQFQLPLYFSSIYNYTYAAKMRQFDQGLRTSFIPNTGNPIIAVDFNKNSDPGAVGYVDYFWAKGRCTLDLSGSNALMIRDSKSIGPGKITKFVVQNASNAQCWNVTNPNEPQIIFGNVLSNQQSFTVETDQSQTLLVFNPNFGFPAPRILGPISNQNIHQTPACELLVIYHPLFKNEVGRLKQHKQQLGWKIETINVEEIYQEFASGKQDIAAIRNFIRMMYERGKANGVNLENVLLFGDASYDYKNRISNNTNFIPTFESPETVEPLYTYACDFYYGLLDSTEGRFSITDRGNIDVGIGRFPVSTTNQANAMIDKVIDYENNLSCGDWKSMITLVADDGDFNKHLEDSEILADSIRRNFPNAIIDKVYIDAFARISTPGGSRYPDANKAIDNRINQGSLVVNYVGHGGVNGWADERILTPEDVLSWSAPGKYPIFTTATCEFSRFDDPGKISVGEEVLFQPKGGPVSSFTTVRLTYSEPNLDFTKKLYHELFTSNQGKVQTIGQSFINAINANGIDNSNTRCLTILGDPSLRPMIPQQGIRITKINNHIPGQDTISALSMVKMEGEILDLNGNVDQSFQGTAYPSVFDKPQTFYTFGAQSQSIAVPISTQLNALFKGKATVTNGRFQFEFLAPKDIAYQYGNGRVVVYALNENKHEALGDERNFIIGGTSSSISQDDQGPQVQAYLNTTFFIDGGITHNHPTLLAKVFDESGINMVGNGLGHDIVMILDGKVDQPFNLNLYYESDLDNFKKGWIRFPMSKLDTGKHTLEVKVWDVHNNLGTAFIQFEVIDTTIPTLLHLSSYPNPSSGNVRFNFSHNLAQMPLKATLEIMDISGKSVFQSTKDFKPEGFQEMGFEWDGTDELGKKIAAGLYVYRIQIRLDSGQSLQGCQKLIRYTN